jgi:preprotein translocase subunit YajC
MIALLCLLAQSAPTSQPVAPPGPADFLRSPLVPLILVLVIFWWVMSRGRGKEKQRYEQMLSSLKKNDRVQTMGGMIGTVFDVRDNVVILKVDEASNTKIHFNRSAIKEVLRDAPVDDEKK